MLLSVKSYFGIFSSRFCDDAQRKFSIINRLSELAIFQVHHTELLRVCRSNALQSAI